VITGARIAAKRWLARVTATYRRARIAIDCWRYGHAWWPDLSDGTYRLRCMECGQHSRRD
jgi:hypothetical protein